MFNLPGLRRGLLHEMWTDVAMSRRLVQSRGGKGAGADLANLEAIVLAPVRSSLATTVDENGEPVPSNEPAGPSKQERESAAAAIAAAAGRTALATSVFVTATNLLRESTTLGHGVLNAARLKRAVQERNDLFKGGYQQDAHEFFAFFANELHDDMLSRLGKVVPKSVSEALFTTPGKDDLNSSSSSSSTSSSSDEKVPYEVEKNMCIDAEFRASVCQRRVCVVCGSAKEKDETFLAHSIDLGAEQANQSQDLKALLNKYFSPEERMLKCEVCGGDKVIVSGSLHKLPRTLVLHLKRFQYEPKTMTYVKNESAVVVPEELDVHEFCRVQGHEQPLSSTACNASLAAYVGGVDAACAASSSKGAALGTPVGVDAFNSANKAFNVKRRSGDVEHEGGVRDTGSGHGSNDDDGSWCLTGTTYRLTGMVRHEGPTMQCGHYTADVLRTPAEKEWEHCDDSRVYTVGADAVLSRLTDSYLLMYTHTGAMTP